MSGFWDVRSDSADYIDEPLTDALVARVERVLGYRLPRAYVELMRSQNGGIPRRRKIPTTQRTSWAPDHVAIHGLFGIGDSQRCTLAGPNGSAFYLQEWGYPDLGVYFADCPSAGHDLICFDYRACGPHGEPAVVHVDQDLDYRVTPLAADCAAFLRALE